MLEFDPKDKPKNLEQIKNHFDNLDLYSFFDFEIVQDENKLDVQNIDYAIVAAFAVWSGYSYSISSHILNEIKDESKPKLQVILIDTDYFSIERQMELFETAMHGYFDCCLIIDGKIVKKHKSKSEVTPFIEAVKESR